MFKMASSPLGVGQHVPTLVCGDIGIGVGECHEGPSLLGPKSLDSVGLGESAIFSPRKKARAFQAPVDDVSPFL
ncbi:hypothetical protein COP2_045516 [Malus domestica]